MDPGHQVLLELSPAVSGLMQIDLSTLGSFGIMLLLLIFSGLFSSAEAAFFSLSPAHLALINSPGAGRSYQIIRQLLNNPKKLLATLLISNNLVNMGVILISMLIMRDQLQLSNALPALMLQAVAVTLLIVVFGEVMPKMYAAKRTLGLATAISYPIYVIDKLLSPVSSLLVASTGIIDNRLRRKGYEVSMDELTHAIDISSDVNTPADEKKILKGIVKSGNTDVTQVMKSRMDIVAIEMSLPFSGVLKIINESGYSRLPVYEESLDRVRGILFIKDLILHIDAKDDFRWQELMRPPFFIPESKKINDLLQEFQEKKIHLALVVDEYGGTTGMLTLEDVLEEIVGEMADEFDDEEPLYSKLDDENYVFEGKTLLNDICRVLDLEMETFDEIPGESTTLAGMLLELAGRIPQRNEVITFGQLKFTIESADKRRIKRVKIFRPAAFGQEK